MLKSLWTHPRTSLHYYVFDCVYVLGAVFCINVFHVAVLTELRYFQVSAIRTFTTLHRILITVGGVAVVYVESVILIPLISWH